MDLNPRIVDTAGREMYGVGGEQAYATGIHRGYAWSLEWFIGARTTEPMLCIWPAITYGEAPGVWGICLSSAGKFADPSGKPTPEAAHECATALRETFGRVALGVEIHALLDLLMLRIPDLILMPPTPRAHRLAAKRAPVLEVERRENGKTVAEVSL